MIFAALVLSALPVSSGSAAPPGPTPGDTQVARWKDNKQAAISLMFDDSVPSDITTVVPELQKRKMTGTFYVNPGGWGWKKDPSAWEKQLPAMPGVVFANHTMTHKGAVSVPQLDDELRLCNDVIRGLFPGNQRRLISFGQPGVKKENWTITDDQLKHQLEKYNLIQRPTSAGQLAMITVKSPDQMLAAVDKALDRNAWEYFVFHGVGGDWIITPTDIFVKFLDGLETRRTRLWITDHISIYQYETERNSAAVKLLDATDLQIRISLTSPADPQQFDMPLTLLTRVPAAWQRCRIVQGKLTSVAAAHEGLLQYDAMPGDEPITLQPDGERAR